MEKLEKLRSPRGKLHDYIGMSFNFSTSSEVRITIID